MLNKFGSSSAHAVDKTDGHHCEPETVSSLPGYSNDWVEIDEPIVIQTHH